MIKNLARPPQATFLREEPQKFTLVLKNQRPAAYTKKSRFCARLPAAMAHGPGSVTLRNASSMTGPVPDQASPVLYTHLCCPYAQRSLLCLLEKGVEFSIVHVDLAKKPSWYAKINVHELVPAVSYQGQQMTESIDICRWADAELPGPSLMPSHPDAIAAVNRIITSSSSFAAAGLAMVGGKAGSWAIGSQHSRKQQEAFQAEVRKLEQALESSGGPFLAGKSITLADAIIWPFMERFVVALEHVQAYHVREQAGPTVAAWIDAMQQAPSSKLASPDEQCILSAFRTHMRLDFFDFHTFDATALHPHLQHLLVS